MPSNADSTPRESHLLPPFFDEQFNQAEDFFAKLNELLDKYRGMQSQCVRLYFRREWLRLFGASTEKDPKLIQASLEQFTRFLNDGVLTDIEAKLRKLDDKIRSIETGILAEERAIAAAASDPIPATPDYLPHEAITLELFLRREGLLPQARPLPKPLLAPATGQQGKSRVYHLYVSAKQGNRYLVAKFDEQGRDAHEWDKIERLRDRKLPGIILPLKNNRQGDGVIVAEAAGTDQAQRVMSLAEYYRKSPKTRDDLPACFRCLDLAFHALEGFYQHEPGVHDENRKDRTLCWSHLYPKLADSLADSRSVVEQAWPNLDWAGSENLDFPLTATSRSLPNPYFAFARLWPRPTHSLLLARTHGDLNLTNLLVCTYPSRWPHQVFVIDIAESEPEQAPSADFAFLEAQFWNEVYYHSAHDLDLMLAHYVAMRDWLDGRAGGAPPIHGETMIVRHLRHLAYQRLATEPRAAYVLNDFFYCLYFTYMRILTFSTVQQNPAQVRLNVLGAALSLQVLNDLEDRFLYAGQNGNRRPWESPPHQY